MPQLQNLTRQPRLFVKGSSVYIHPWLHKDSGITNAGIMIRDNTHKHMHTHNIYAYT